MLGGVIILIIYIALTLGWIVVAIATVARVLVFSTLVGPMLVAGRILRSAPCLQSISKIYKKCHVTLI